MVGWSANAPSGSISCSAGDAAPARRWRGRYGAAVFIWIAGQRAGKRPGRRRESWLAGLSASGSLSTLSWAATGYGCDNAGGGETRLTLPLGESINVNLQNMLASDSSWSSVGSISATLPGDSVQCGLTRRDPHWRSIAAQRCRQPGDRRHPQPERAVVEAGTFSVSYNDDRRYNSHYYTADYYQTVYSGAFGSLGLRAGIQRYNNGDSSANTGKISPSIRRCRWATGSAPG